MMVDPRNRDEASRRPASREASAGRRRRLAGAVSALAAMVLCSAAFAQSALSPEEFRLQPRTRIKLSLLEWLPASGEYKDWTVISGEYVVSPSGRLSLPLVGELSAGDRTADDVQAEIAARLKQRTGLLQTPEASIQIVAYPPIIVVGRVARPGEYPFTPGMTALQGYALAGGRDRATDYASLTTVEQIRYLGELERLERQMPRLEMRQARLVAERDGAAEFAMPPMPDDGGDIQPIYQSERQLFEVRLNSFTRQTANLDELVSLLKREIESLAEKSASLKRQLEIARLDLENVAGLVRRGAATRPRQSELERLVASMESDLLDINLASMRASQRVSETEREAETLKGDRENQVTRDLQEVEVEVEDTRLKISNTRAALIATGAEIERMRTRENAPDSTLIYSVLHSGTRTSARVDEHAELRPGDVLRVDLDLGRESGATSVSEAPAEPETAVDGKAAARW